MDSKDKQLDDKKRKLAQLKLAKERLEAELAAFDDELSEQEAKLTDDESSSQATKKKRRVASQPTESESSIALKSPESKQEAPTRQKPVTRKKQPKKSVAPNVASPTRNEAKPQSTDQPAKAKATSKAKEKRKSTATPAAAAAAVAASTQTPTQAKQPTAKPQPENTGTETEPPVAETTEATPTKAKEQVKRPVSRTKTAPTSQPAASQPATQAAATATATMAQQNAEATAEEDAEDEEYEDDPSPSIFAIRSAPPWLVSTILHVVGLTILGLYTLASLPKEEKTVILASAIEEQEEDFEELTEMTLEVEEVEFENVTSEAISEMDPGATNFADVTAAVEASSEGMEKVNLAKTTIGEIGNMFGTEGQGFADIGEGLAGSGTFFGKKAQGNKFVFVVDNSLSMGRGRFVTALDEMMKSISRMTEKQQFYIIFFSDTAYPMFHPNPAPGLMPATERNKERVAAWLYTVERCLKTKGELALEKALSLRPDVIYILGDGAFTDKTGPKLMAPHNRRTIINTFGMEVAEKGRVELTGIAAANKGTFTPVKPSPAAAQEGRNIKNNRTRGPVWGIDLPLVDKKKK